MAEIGSYATTNVMTIVYYDISQAFKIPVHTLVFKIYGTRYFMKDPNEDDIIDFTNERNSKISQKLDNAFYARIIIP